MSAVPPEPPRASATPTQPASDHADGKAPPGPAGTDFGPNEWLVDELYQRYLADPGSVDMAWWNFFRLLPAHGGGRTGHQRRTGRTGQPSGAAAGWRRHPGPHGTGSARGEPPGGGPGQRGRPGLLSRPSFCG